MKTTEIAKIFLLGMAAAFLGMLAYNSFSSNKAMAAAGGAAISPAGDLMALAVAGQGDKSALYLIDPANKYIAHYTYDGSTFSLRSARCYRYDLIIGDYNEKGGLKIKDVKDEAEKWAKDMKKLKWE